MSDVAAPAIPAVAPLAAAQHKAALWADEALHVHAVMMGSRLPDLPATLADAELVDFDCLLPGALAPDVQRGAPYLARLKADSPFTDWLLFEAAASIGDWGVLVRSPVRLTALRNHLRDLLTARLPGGHQIAFDWMDPPLLQAVLPLFGAGELAAFFGPVQSLVVPGADAWTHSELAAGRLLQRLVPVAKEA